MNWLRRLFARCLRRPVDESQDERRRGLESEPDSLLARSLEERRREIESDVRRLRREADLLLRRRGKL